MSGEKISAFYESWNAMLVAACRANLQFVLSAPAWSTLWVKRSHRAGMAKLQRTALDILASGAAPIHRRAVGNAKRLRR
jgi:hypothetical protein